MPNFFCEAFPAVWGGKGFAWFDARGKFIDLGEEVNASGELFLRSVFCRVWQATLRLVQREGEVYRPRCGGQSPFPTFLKCLVLQPSRFGLLFFEAAIVTGSGQPRQGTVITCLAKVAA